MADTPEIQVFCVGSTSKPMSYGAVLCTTSPNGDGHVYEHSGVIGDYTKNQADIISIIMALRCIKSENRDWPVILYSPPGYASSIVNRSEDGEWRSTPQANLDLVKEVRTIVSLFKNLRLDKCKRSNEHFARCLELIEGCKKET